VRVKPIYGWGFDETIDGELAAPFDAEISEVGVDIDSGIRGWRGTALNGKYSGARLEMTPRHKPFDGIVVLDAYFADGQSYYFKGMAETTGLECKWL
jgi:hypothetical protein